MNKKEMKKQALNNIALLEKADDIALTNLSNNILKPKYRKVLTAQDKDLKHYLDVYKTPDALPLKIANTFEFPNYFYYEGNSKTKGKINRRTRLDGKMFKKFMKNNTKREMAKAQGIKIDKIKRVKKQIAKNIKEEGEIQEYYEPQELKQLGDTALNFDFIENPKFEKLKKFKSPKLKALTDVDVIEFRANEPNLTFLLPEPDPAPKDVKKDYANIEEMVQGLYELGGSGDIPYQTQNGIIFTISEVSILKKYQSGCIVHNVIYDDHRLPMLYLNYGILIQIPYQDTIDVDALGTQLAECVSRNVPLIVIPVTLVFSTGGAHANLLIYRVFKKTWELFEPHGSYTVFSTKIESQKIAIQINKILRTIMNGVEKYVGRLRYLPAYTIINEQKGFQALESKAIGKDIAKEGGGYCAFWSSFFLELLYLNPSKTSKEITRMILDLTREDPTYLRQMIRGYVITIEQMLKEVFAQVLNIQDYSNKEYSKGQSKRNDVYNYMDAWNQLILNIATENKNIVFDLDVQRNLEHNKPDDIKKINEPKMDNKQILLDAINMASEIQGIPKPKGISSATVKQLNTYILGTNLNIQTIKEAYNYLLDDKIKEYMDYQDTEKDWLENDGNMTEERAEQHNKEIARYQKEIDKLLKSRQYIYGSGIKFKKCNECKKSNSSL